jgi:hypothetical protein
MWDWPSFWLMCGTSAVCFSIPRIVQAVAESRCEHKWEMLRQGKIVDDTALPADQQTVEGYYHLYRCEKCGARREYR